MSVCPGLYVSKHKTLMLLQNVLDLSQAGWLNDTSGKSTYLAYLPVPLNACSHKGDNTVSRKGQQRFIFNEGSDDFGQGQTELKSGAQHKLLGTSVITVGEAILCPDYLPAKGSR